LYSYAIIRVSLEAPSVNRYNAAGLRAQSPELDQQQSSEASNSVTLCAPTEKRGAAAQTARHLLSPLPR
ncbi:hypothetical protein OEZ84_26385, partial [Leclercia adecarboxylata]|uniref:hypothetical protein n=1 Tax=Leclercia adecarboxylata TaxID=83655 RepID=UPI00234C670F